jgi:hypothetical protein
LSVGDVLIPFVLPALGVYRRHDARLPDRHDFDNYQRLICTQADQAPLADGQNDRPLYFFGGRRRGFSIHFFRQMC